MNYQDMLEQMDKSSGKQGNVQKPSSGVDYEGMLRNMDSAQPSQASKEKPLPNLGDDLLKTLPGIPVRAGAGIVGLPQSLLSLSRQAQDNYRNPIVPRSPVGMANDALMDILAGRRNIPFTDTKIPNIGDLAQKGWGLLTGGATDYQPQTPVAKVLDAAGQMALSGGKGGATIGQTLQRALIGAGGGLAEESVGSLGGSPGQKMAGQVAGSLLSGAAIGKAVNMSRNMSSGLAKKTLEDMWPGQRAEAQDLYLKAQSIGTPITTAEAIAQTSGNTNLLKAQQGIESGKYGQDVRNIMANRADANRAAFNDQANQIAVRGDGSAQIPGRMQSAAEGYLKDLEDFRTGATSPLYQAQGDIDRSVMKARNWIDDLNDTKSAAIDSRGSEMNKYGQKINAANQIWIDNGSPIRYIKTPGAAGAETGDNFDIRAIPRIEAEAHALPNLDLARERTSEINRVQNNIDTLKDSIPIEQESLGESVSNLLRKVSDQKKLSSTEQINALNWLENELHPNGQQALYPSQLAGVSKSIRSQVDINPLTATPAQKTWSGVLGSYGKQINNLLTSSSPLISEAKHGYKQLSDLVVDPFKRDLIGQIANTPVGVGVNAKSQFNHISNVLMPAGGQPGLTPGAIKKNVSLLNAQDPTAARDFVRENLQSSFDESAKDFLKSGRSQLGAAQFAEKIAGNQTQRENLKALMEAAGGTDAANGFMKMLDVFMAQGERLPPQRLPGGELQGSEVLKMGITKRIDGMLGGGVSKFDSWIRGRSTKDIAESLTSKDGLDALKKMAYERPKTARFNTLMGTALGASNQESQK